MGPAHPGSPVQAHLPQLTCRHPVGTGSYLAFGGTVRGARYPAGMGVITVVPLAIGALVIVLVGLGIVWLVRRSR